MNNQTLDRLKSRIEEHGQPDDIEQLCLDGLQIEKFTPQICYQLNSCPQMVYLTLNHCEIKSLEHFPPFQELLALQLIGNQIPGSDIKYLKNQPKLQHLALDKNQILDIEELRPLNEIPELEHLQLRGNPVCQIDDYRAKIFEIIPKLKIIDSQDIFGDEDVMLQTETDSENSVSIRDELSQQQQQNSQQYQHENQGRKHRNL